MVFDPTSALRRKKNTLEFSDRKVGHFASQPRIQTLVESLGHLIFNEVGFRNLAERQTCQLVARLPAYVIIACATDVQITLFELVGEHEGLAKLIASHGENDSRSERVYLNRSTNSLAAYLNSEHGFGAAEEVGTGTKARLRISAFRDSAAARA